MDVGTLGCSYSRGRHKNRKARLVTVLSRKIFVPIRHVTFACRLPPAGEANIESIHCLPEFSAF